MVQVTRWTRYGHDRLYVNDDEARLGYLDLKTGVLHVDAPGREAELRRALATHHLSQDRQEAPPSSRTAPASPVSSAAPTVLPGLGVTDIPAQDDLALRQAGAGLRAEQHRHRDGRSPLTRAWERVTGQNTPERRYRVGARGEEAIGSRLDRLAESGWLVLHSVPVGTRGADIDHVLIGPAGVFTVNTKNRPDAQVKVTARAVYVGGHSTDYAATSRHEAQRAARLLHAALGHAVPVHPVLVILTGTLFPTITVQAQPDDVTVLSRTQIPGWFTRQPSRLTAAEIPAILDIAR